MPASADDSVYRQPASGVADIVTGGKDQGPEEQSGGGHLVRPFARALQLLQAYSAQESWLSHSALVTKTGLPPATVTRLARTLVQLGYLLHSPVTRRFALSARVLALGHPRNVDPESQWLCRQGLTTFAERFDVNVSLSTREGLDLLVIFHCQGTNTIAAPLTGIGCRTGIFQSVAGMAMMAALPQDELDYLLSSPRVGNQVNTQQLRQHCHEIRLRICTDGFHTALDWDSQRVVLATPVMARHADILVLSCEGSAAQLTRQRIKQELGPHLCDIARRIAHSGRDDND